MRRRGRGIIGGGIETSLYEILALRLGDDGLQFGGGESVHMARLGGH
jgi:hypothetical protein